MAEYTVPEIRYARSGDLSIAYQVFGRGRGDLVFVPGIVSHLELGWQDPFLARFLLRLGDAFRVIAFDKRGQGMSDRIDGVPSLEERIDDLRAVMDAAGSERATVFGMSEGAPMSILFAAGNPAKVERLILFGGMARFVGAEDYPHQPPLEVYLEHLVAAWGSGALAPLMAPDGGYAPGYAERLARFERMSASPGAIRQALVANERIDVRPILTDVRQPTLVIHRHDDRAAARENGRYLADNISDATYLELPGRSHFPWLGDADRVVDAVLDFASEHRTAPVHEALDERRLATALFTDIVRSTEQLAAMGDHRWRETLDRHDRIAETVVAEFRGHIVKHTGDGILALFDGPARAVRCAEHLIEALAGIGLAIRAGLQIGEIVERGADVTGLAVNTAARVMECAAPGEVLLTRTILDLTGGSGIPFDAAGSHVLKGIPGSFELFRPASEA